MGWRLVSCACKNHPGVVFGAIRTGPCFDTEESVLEDYWLRREHNLWNLLPDFKFPVCHFLDYGSQDVLFNLSHASISSFVKWGEFSVYFVGCVEGHVKYLELGPRCKCQWVVTLVITGMIKDAIWVINCLSTEVFQHLLCETRQMMLQLGLDFQFFLVHIF